MSRTPRWPGTAWRRLRAGWADPHQRLPAVRYLIGAHVTLWIGLALLVGTRTGLALIAAMLAATAAAMLAGLALLVLWGRDL